MKKSIVILFLFVFSISFSFTAANISGNNNKSKADIKCPYLQNHTNQGENFLSIFIRKNGERTWNN